MGASPLEMSRQARPHAQAEEEVERRKSGRSSALHPFSRLREKVPAGRMRARTTRCAKNSRPGEKALALLQGPVQVNLPCPHPNPLPQAGEGARGRSPGKRSAPGIQPDRSRVRLRFDRRRAVDTTNECDFRTSPRTSASHELSRRNGSIALHDIEQLSRVAEAGPDVASTRWRTP